MPRNVTQSTSQVRGAAAPRSDGFDLNVRLLEVTDPAGLTNLSTDDNCGFTCGACTTNVA